MKRALKANKINKPCIDNETRWSSTYQMLRSLLPAKEICNDFSENDKALHLSEKTWESIQNYVDVLKPVYETTLILQKEQLLPGDFYAAWVSCYLQIKKIKSHFANDLCTSMKKREQLLLDNDAFLAAMFFDPRYMRLIFNSDDETFEQRAIKKVKNVWKRLSETNKDLEQLDSSQSNINLTEEVKLLIFICYKAFIFCINIINSICIVSLRLI